MDKVLRLERLDADPSQNNSPKLWFSTFENFLINLSIDVSNLNSVKLNVLINYISPTLFAYICEKKNEIFARHLFANRRQEVGETLDTNFQARQLLSRDCSFSSVNAERNRCDYVRDSFINGLASNEARRWLLENSDFQMMEAFDQAKTLELAQKQADLYMNSRMIPLNATTQLLFFWLKIKMKF
ncbi:unnamed protein product [Lepeophtheirus salmonis]|uniref:(salmon louse) hypothetical protein n=1 Tax=Lepeophtheirus salmonis TaxID=72036 RepID=A0A7R8H433_LEPSM|nr:unnamed protein product [Lepeophtheirus salmonis]CAF2852458.1 unnamed protein product [Lepeophtheirus salmonis]